MYYLCSGVCKKTAMSSTYNTNWDVVLHGCDLSEILSRVTLTSKDIQEVMHTVTSMLVSFHALTPDNPRHCAFAQFLLCCCMEDAHHHCNDPDAVMEKRRLRRVLTSWMVVNLPSNRIQSLRSPTTPIDPPKLAYILSVVSLPDSPLSANDAYNVIDNYISDRKCERSLGDSTIMKLFVMLDATFGKNGWKQGLSKDNVVEIINTYSTKTDEQRRSVYRNYGRAEWNTFLQGDPSA